MLKKISALLLLIFLASPFANASPVGINFSYLLINKDPNYLHAYRTSIQYMPASWIWEHWQILIDGGYGHWWINNTNPYSSLNIYSVAPIFRYYFKNSTFISPFFDLSIGLSYLTKTHIGDRNLGIHFAFQDQIGLGASLGADKKLAISLSALHYSNGSMSSKNAGITVPLMLNMSYRF